METSSVSCGYDHAILLFFNCGPNPAESANCRNISGQVNGFKCRCQFRMSKPHAYAWYKIMSKKVQLQWGKSSREKKNNKGLNTEERTPSTICGCPPPGLAAPFWFIPNPVEGVLATSSISFIINLRRARCISPNNLESYHQNGMNTVLKKDTKNNVIIEKQVAEHWLKEEN